MENVTKEYTGFGNWRECLDCGDDVHIERWTLGYHWCKFCGEDRAKADRASWTIAPMHKSNYMLFTDPTDLIGINNKGGLVK